MNKFLTLALFGTALSVAVHADTTIRLTGSTAFRGLVYNALNSNFFTSGVTNYGASGESVFTFQGTKTWSSGNTEVVTVKCAWSGSVEGIINVLHTTGASDVAQPAFRNIDGTVDSSTTQADFAFTDVAQDTTSFGADNSFSALTEFPADISGTYAGLGAGIVTFVWAKNAQTPSVGITNITSSQIQVGIGVGSVSRGFLLGNSADTTPVYFTGRYAFSGTRLVAQADSGFGANTSSSLVRNDLGDLFASGGSNYNADGYIGGGDVRGALQAATTNPLLAYLSAGDAVGKAGVGLLSYNGVTFSRAAVISGQYSFWSSERIYADISGVSANKSRFMNGVGSNAASRPYLSNGFIKALDTALKADANYVSVSEMKASRGSDGGLITPN